MNVVVIGSGGREHAITWKIGLSSQVKNLYCIPGNPGTETVAKNVELNPTDKKSIENFCEENNIDLVVIGPEQPLVDGLADHLRNAGFNVFGPDSEAAQIEGSKAFAKEIMIRADIPTASYKQFSSDQFEDAKKYLTAIGYPVVIKADGLAAGKGVIICSTENEALISLKEMLEDKKFGAAGEKLIIEEYLTGEEASVFAITDGDDFITLPASQDHKRIGDNDTGKNTGGMGAYAPAPVVTKELMKLIEEKIISPTLKQLKKEGKEFIGCLYVGLMITDDGPKVIEFNCRFGDPETQVVLPLLNGDLFELLYSAAKGEVDNNSVKYSGGSSVCVVAASAGYPGSYQKNMVINWIENPGDDIIIFQAGTKKSDGNIVTAGGRVLGVTSVIKDNDLKKAKAKAYSVIQKINFDGIYYRKDISDKALKHL